MNRILLPYFLLLLIGCNTTEKNSNGVFFAGEIVNPTSNYVVLHKGEKVIDSALLDTNNRFYFSLDSISQGLYSFNHTPEHQYVYFEPGDSLMMRLNTVDFDESLVFSGQGEEINNFLIDLFLNNEKELSQIRKKYNALKPDEFEAKIYSLRKQKTKDLNALQAEGTISEAAYEIAEASVNYTYFNYLERYPFVHKKINKSKKIPELSKNYYNFRKQIDFNNPKLTYLRPYYNYMRSHFGNLSFSTCSDMCETNNKNGINKLHFNKHKLKLIDSIVLEKELKDNLFRNIAINYLLKTKDSSKNNDSFVKEFHALSNSNRHIEEINNLYQGIKNIQPGKKIPNIVVACADERFFSLPEITAGKKVIIYFWSATNKEHYKNIFKRVSELKEIKKEYTFIGINFKTNKDNWKNIVESFKLNKKEQYRASDFKELSNNLIIHPINKCIITEDTAIVDAFSNIYRKF